MQSPGKPRRQTSRSAAAAALLLAFAALGAASLAQAQRPAAGETPSRAHYAQTAPSAAVSGMPESSASQVGTAARTAAGSAAGAPDPVADKFRKLQKEMTGGGSAGGRESVPPAPAEPPGLLPVSFKILFGLAFVILLAVVCIRLLKRMQGGLARPAQASGGSLIEVLETCHLGPQQRVVALRINDEVGIVGVTQHGISLLTTLAQPADEVRKRMAGSGNPAAFSESLNKLLERFKKPKRVSDLLDEQA